jgi:hypothetical protein
MAAAGQDDAAMHQHLAKGSKRVTRKAGHSVATAALLSQPGTELWLLQVPLQVTVLHSATPEKSI